MVCTWIYIYIFIYLYTTASQACPAGKEYKVNYLGDYLCSGPADEPVGPASSGCFCKDGLFLDGADCVTIDGCGCSLDGVYMKVSFWFITFMPTLGRSIKINIVFAARRTHF